MKTKKSDKGRGKTAPTKHANKQRLLKTFGLLLGLILIVAFSLFLIQQYNAKYPTTGEAKSTLVRAWCNDSDNKEDYLTKGTVKSNLYPHGKEDYCYTFPNGKTYLMEGFCKDQKYVYGQKNCWEPGKYKCKDGACVSWCEDTDGNNKSVQGTVYSNLYPSGKKDECVKGKYAVESLMEGVCQDGEAYFYEFNCKFTSPDLVCKQGACVIKQPPGVKETLCEDSDNKDYFTKGKVIETKIYEDGSNKSSPTEDYCAVSSEGKVYLAENVCEGSKLSTEKVYCGDVKQNHVCQDGVCILKEEVELELIYGDGNNNHLDFVFVPLGFSKEAITLGDVKKVIERMIYGDKEALLLSTKTGFFDIAPIQSNLNKINIYLIKKDVSSICGTSCSWDKHLYSFALTYAPFVIPQKDIVVNLAAESSWAAGGSMGIDKKTISVSQTSSSSTFAHEFGHTFSQLNDEYFWPGEFLPENNLYEPGKEQTGWGAKNCDFHKKPEMWCESVDEEKYSLFLKNSNLSEICYDTLQNKDENKWYEICPQLNLSGMWGVDFGGKVCVNLSLLFETKQIELNGKKLGVYPFWSCFKQILEPMKYLNFGKNCKDGYGYYFGCGAVVNAFRPTPFSIMGCGDSDDCSSVYGYEKNGMIIGEPLYPEAIPEYNSIANEEIQKYFGEYS